MTNYEHYKEEISRITNLGLAFAINKNSQQVESCSGCRCEDCLFIDVIDCTQAKLKWAYEEYTEPVVDWSKVPVDTKVYVKNCKGGEWRKRYFAKYENGQVCTFSDGRTSWSDVGKTVSWEYAKLAEEE